LYDARSTRQASQLYTTRQSVVHTGNFPAT